MDIVPALLVKSKAEYLRYSAEPIWRAVDCAHLDGLDGSKYGMESWFRVDELGVVEGVKAMNEIGARPASLGAKTLELHLMTATPTTVLEWAGGVGKIKRIILENSRPSAHLIANIMAFTTQGFEVVIALNPNDQPDDILLISHLIQGVQIMGVYPGKSGQRFLGETIIAKMKRCAQLFPNLAITVDGGVNQDNILAIKNAGASRVVIASALWESPTPLEKYQQMLNLVR